MRDGSFAQPIDQGVWQTRPLSWALGWASCRSPPGHDWAAAPNKSVDSHGPWAWNSKSTAAVASFYADEGEIIINNGTPWSGRVRVQDMAAGFYAEVPDLTLTCDDVRCAGDHVIFIWTFTGHDAATGHPLNIRGWEEWDIGDDLKVIASPGWFDAADYAAQAAGG